MNQRCKRFVTQGKTQLCRFHMVIAKAKMEGRPHPSQNRPGPDPTPSDVAKSGISTRVKKQAASISNFIITNQAHAALQRLGLDMDESTGRPVVDPKRVLLNTVESAWNQQRVWETMLAAVPKADWEYVGSIPIPGSPSSARGARIEAIQKYLGEATKVAARTSKLALDAGIEERLVHLAEEQSALIADTVRAGLIAGIAILHLSQVAERAAIEAATTSAAHHLRALAAGGDEIIEGVARVVNARETPLPVYGKPRARPSDVSNG
jgi:hypothetical protein